MLPISAKPFVWQAENHTKQVKTPPTQQKQKPLEEEWWALKIQALFLIVLQKNIGLYHNFFNCVIL